MTEGLDLSSVPVVDGHMHAPLRARPRGLEEYRWLWYEGRREDLNFNLPPIVVPSGELLRRG